MGCSQMTNSAGHAQRGWTSSGGTGPTGIGSPMPTGMSGPVVVASVLNTHSARGSAGAQKLASGTHGSRRPGWAAAVGRAYQLLLRLAATTRPDEGESHANGSQTL